MKRSVLPPGRRSWDPADRLMVGALTGGLVTAALVSITGFVSPSLVALGTLWATLLVSDRRSANSRNSSHAKTVVRVNDLALAFPADPGSGLRGGRLLPVLPRREDIPRLTVATIALLGLSACTGISSPGTPSQEASAYEAVISSMIDGVEIQPDGLDQLPVLFIEAFASGGIPLVVQVEVVAAFDESYDVRFIDDREAATEADEAAQSVVMPKAADT